MEAGNRDDQAMQGKDLERKAHGEGSNLITDQDRKWTHRSEHGECAVDVDPLCEVVAEAELEIGHQGSDQDNEMDNSPSREGPDAYFSREEWGVLAEIPRCCRVVVGPLQKGTGDGDHSNEQPQEVNRIIEQNDVIQLLRECRISNKAEQ